MKNLLRTLVCVFGMITSVYTQCQAFRQSGTSSFFKSFILALSMLVVGSVYGQDVLITTSNGGFEATTSSFAANGWTAVGSSTRTWRVGTAGGAATGTKAAYWGTTTVYGGTNTSSVGHFYRDIAIPAGATNVFLNYKLKYPTVDNTYDYFYVFTTTTSNTPVNGTIPSTGYTNRFTNTASAYTSFTAMPQVNLTALAGTTVRLVFTFKSDNASPHVAPAVDDITLTYIAGSACTGTPAPGNTISSSATVAPSGTVNLSLQNTTSGSGVTYQWQSSATLGGTYVNVTGGTGATTASHTTAALTTATWFRCRVTCGGNTANSTPVGVTLSYCMPIGATNYWLSNVVTTGGQTNISNTTSASAGGYINYSSTISCSNYIGATTTITLTPSSGTNYFYCWIDWNNDLDFADANETIFATTSYTSNHTGTITIPTGTSNGNYRIRVANSWSGAITSCGPSSNGEYEDYTFSVVSAPACSGLPSNIISSTVTTTTATLSWTAASPAPGDGYDIYYSTSSTTPVVGTVATTTTATGITTKNLSGLTTNTTYYWWVRSNCNGTDKSTWVSGGTFYTCAGSCNSVCPSIISSLPVTNQGLSCTSVALPGSFSSSNVTVCGGASGFYLGGQEALYMFTPSTTGEITISYSGQTYSSIWLFQGCPTSGGTCVGSVGSSASTQSLTANVTSGITYYLIFDTWPTPNSPCTGTFSISIPCTIPTAGGTLTSNKLETVVNDAISLTTTGNGGSTTLIEWSYNNFSSVAGSFANPTNPYSIAINVQESSVYFRTTSQDGICPVGVSNIVEVNLINAPVFTYGVSDGDYITNVTLGNINNTSTNDGDAYEDFTSQIIDLNIGDSYELLMSSTNTASPGQGKAAWIDFNQDGTFQTTENIMQKAPASSVSQQFTVPEDALVGDTKMRVISVWNATPSTDAYNSTGYGYGEIEEYTVRMSAPVGLPVELTQFTATSHSDYNTIKWTTSSESNSDYYSLLSSEDGESWVEIRKETAAGNSVEELNYFYIDYTKRELTYYKLRQFDKDGNNKTYGPILAQKLISSKVILKYTNILGQDINPQNTKGVIIIVFDDGTTQKIIR
jgi:hypothetical protein